MVTSALVVTLHGDEASLRAATTALERDGRLTVGAIEGRRLPVVAETAGLAAAETLVGELLDTPGVAAVDVVRVDFDPDTDVDGAIHFGRRARADVGADSEYYRHTASLATPRESDHGST